MLLNYFLPKYDTIGQWKVRYYGRYEDAYTCCVPNCENKSIAALRTIDDEKNVVKVWLCKDHLQQAIDEQLASDKLDKAEAMDAVEVRVAEATTSLLEMAVRSDPNPRIIEGGE